MQASVPWSLSWTPMRIDGGSWRLARIDGIWTRITTTAAIARIAPIGRLRGGGPALASGRFTTWSMHWAASSSARSASVRSASLVRRES